MNIVFDDEALEDLRGIRAWIAKNSPRAADQLITRIFGKIEYLLEPELTYMGRPGLDPGTRELIEFPYIIVYEVHEERREIVVLAIVHGAQKRKRAK
ncbi:MAG: type II toxin-antitoxin system RelE/ParE family toxin [Xanthobacteraceae bacterium]